jgi:O-acetyl-ADP-ribose deacetylase (regulator of RNase III)
MISYKQTNLFDSTAEALVNTVNLVGVMGKGIALQFKDLFDLNYKQYLKACKSNHLHIGKMFVTETGLLTNPKYIINFPTKTDWRSYTKMEYINKGLDDLVNVINTLNIKSIAIPPLGCGNGGLDWNDVRPIIERKLSGISEDVVVEIYEPGIHSYTKTVASKKMPKLTKARAIILSLADKYTVLGFDISHLEIQKLAYFLQELGQNDLNLKFAKGRYGPYATNLKHLLAFLEGTYIKGQIRFQDMKPTDALKLVEENLKAVYSFVSTELTSEEQMRLNQVASLIEGFESPFGMELLATVHWAKKEIGNATSASEIKKYINFWSERKKNIMSFEQIEIALERVNANFN